MKEPELRLIASSEGYSSKALILIPGAWDEDNDALKDYQRYVRYLRAAGWKNAIYALWWDSSREYVFKLEKALTWKRVKKRADEVGQDYFSDLVSEIPEKEISIIAFSAGARVAFYGLETWTNYHHILKDTILLAGALRRDDKNDWGYAASKLSGYLINIYNSDDPDMKIYRQGAGLNSPCGLKPIEERHPKIINFDATSIIGKQHKLSSYIDFLPYITKSGYWNLFTETSDRVSQSEKTITVCPNCTQKLRAPNNLGEIKLTCPKCKHSWLWYLR